jgi:hypothetical protein
MRTSNQTASLWAMLAIGAILDCASVNAQPEQPLPLRLQSTVMPSQKERAVYRRALQATFTDPSDPHSLARFAAIAIRFGDIEGAISALERMLLIDGDHPELKLELGVLHYRIGSRQAAAFYLEAARSVPGASLYVLERAEIFLKAARR